MSCVMGNRLLLNIRQTIRDTDLDAEIAKQNCGSAQQMIPNVEMGQLHAQRSTDSNEVV